MFSISSDKTANIFGVEQLSIVVWFLNEQLIVNSQKVREKFFGFLPLDQLNTESVATNILSIMVDSGINLTQLYGQSYDDCATMAGKVSGVAKIIRDRYTKGHFSLS